MKLSVRATKFFANGTNVSLKEVANAVFEMGDSLRATEPVANGTRFRAWNAGSVDCGTKYVCRATCAEAHRTGCFLGITTIIVVPTPSSLHPARRAAQCRPRRTSGSVAARMRWRSARSVATSTSVDAGEWRPSRRRRGSPGTFTHGARGGSARAGRVDGRGRSQELPILSLADGGPRVKCCALGVSCRARTSVEPPS